MPLSLLLLILFIGVPVAEIAVFIELGGWLGLWPTLTLILVTAIVGVGLVQRQGAGVVSRLRRDLNDNVLPVDAVFDGACIVLAGLLLLTPGFVTDTVGFLLLVPPLRALLAGFLRHRLAAHIHVSAPPPGDGAPPGEGPIIEGEFEEVDEPTRRPDRRGDRIGDDRDSER